MRGYVANTDYDWFRFLASRPHFEEVNFWQPSGGRGFHAIAPGEPFFFKLKKPHYAIGGFGTFLRHDPLPAWLAWESFREANGAPDFETMRRRIERYRSEKVPTGASASYLIGCLIISQPVFFEPDAWIDQPKSWGSQTVQGKTYDLATGEGMALHEMSLMAARSSPHPARLAESTSNSDRYGATQLVRPRLGQGSFRIAVTLAYERACAVTTEHSLPVLEASHIRPYAEGGHHTVSNGLLLRRDIHSLFDLGYVTVNADDHRFEVSKRLKEEWENGRIYYDMRGRKIATPKREEDRPDRALLRWHNDHVFQA